MQKEYIELCVSCCRGEFDIGSIELIKSENDMMGLIEEKVEGLVERERKDCIEDGMSEEEWKKNWVGICEFVGGEVVNKKEKCGVYSVGEEDYCLMFENGSEFWDELKEVKEVKDISEDLYERLKMFEEESW